MVCLVCDVGMTLLDGLLKNGQVENSSLQFTECCRDFEIINVTCNMWTDVLVDVGYFTHDNYFTSLKKGQY